MEFLDMDEQERAFVVASIRIKMESDKKRKRELDRMKKGR
jgi:hypothetical protein